MALWDLTFAGDRRGSVTVASAFFFMIMTGASALTIQGSDLYVKRLQGQRTADLIALAASGTITPISSNAPSATALATANNLAAINGFGSSTLSLTVASNGTSLTAALTTKEEMFLTSIYTGLSSTNVFDTSTSRAQIKELSGCVVALTGAVQVSKSGGISTNLTGSSCDVIAATGLIINSGGLNVAGAAVGISASTEAALLTTPMTMVPSQYDIAYNATITNNPLPTHASITAITSHLTAMTTWPYPTVSPVQPSMPTVVTGSGALSYAGGSFTIPNGHYQSLSVNWSTTITFQGSGAADPSCTNPTTISGTTTFDNSPPTTIVFNSGCYIFGGDFINRAWNQSIYGTAAAGATLTFIFKSNIKNTNGGGIQLPAGTYSINGTIDDSAGNWITLGDGQKVIGGQVINSSYGTITLGNGPFYFLGGISNPYYGKIVIGNGPTYVYNSPVTTGTQYWSQPTVQFGNGPFYFYKSPITNGTWAGIASLLTFGSGPYYFYNSDITLATYSLTYFGWGNMDLYNSSINASGTMANFGNASTSATGSMMVSLNGGTFSFMAGTLKGIGATIAQASGSMFLIGSSLDWEAPTGSSPTYGYQNVAMVNLGGDIAPSANGFQTYTIGGLIYAPSNTISIYWNEYIVPPSGGCLQAVAASVNIYLGANFKSAPCAGMTITAVGNGLPKLQ